MSDKRKQLYKDKICNCNSLPVVVSPVVVNTVVQLYVHYIRNYQGHNLIISKI